MNNKIKAADLKEITILRGMIKARDLNGFLTLEGTETADQLRAGLVAIEEGNGPEAMAKLERELKAARPEARPAIQPAGKYPPRAPYEKRAKVVRFINEEFFISRRDYPRGQYTVKTRSSDTVNKITAAASRVLVVAHEAFPDAIISPAYVLDAFGFYVAVNVEPKPSAVIVELKDQPAAKPGPDLRPELADYPDYNSYHAALVKYLERNPEEIGGK